MRTLRDKMRRSGAIPNPADKTITIRDDSPLMDALVVEPPRCERCRGTGFVSDGTPHSEDCGEMKPCPVCSGGTDPGPTFVVSKEAVTSARIRICTACPGHMNGCDVLLSECLTATETVNGVAAALLGRIEVAKRVVTIPGDQYGTDDGLLRALFSTLKVGDRLAFLDNDPEEK